MEGREDATQKSYRRQWVSESDQDLFNMAGHKDAPQRFYRRRSVSESNHDVFDSPRPPSIHPLFQGSLITLIADLIPNLILLGADLLMNPPGEVWVQDYRVKLEEGKMNELEK